VLSTLQPLATGVYRDAGGRTIVRLQELLDAAGIEATPEQLDWAEQVLRQEMARSSIAVEHLAASPTPEVCHA
jgi:hypothetical protein